jgi:hypothetical protein
LKKIKTLPIQNLEFNIGFLATKVILCKVDFTEISKLKSDSNQSAGSEILFMLCTSIQYLAKSRENEEINPHNSRIPPPP